MADAALVENDVERSRAFVNFLESHGLPLTAALWIFQSDADRWRLVVCPREQRENVSSFYRDFAKLINAAGSPISLLPLDMVDIVAEDSPLVRQLGSVIRVAGTETESIRLTNNVINGVFLDDAIILKLAT